MTESDIQSAIRLELGTLDDVRIWRNNVGVLKDERGKYVTFGLCRGSSDLIGFRSVVITPEMVGKRVAIFAAVEVKTPNALQRGRSPRAGVESRSQRAFISMVNDNGGLAGFATSVEEAKDILEMT